MGEVAAKTKIGELVTKYPMALAVLERYGMNCQECMAMADETIEGAATMHSLQLEGLLEEIRRALEAGRKA